MSFYGQHHEDAWIAEHIKLPEKGIAIEVGAGDGVHLSNTLYWEEKGWDGALVEPDPRNLDRLKGRRRWPVFEGACATRPGPHVFWMMPEPYHSGIGRCTGVQSEVVAFPLQTVIDAMGFDHIDLLSIDTEGTELDVWRSFDNVRFAPKVLIMEFWTQGIDYDPAPDILAELAGRYELRHQTECNFIFTLK